MADKQLDVLVICGSLRKGSYNAALARTLPALTPPGMKLRPAPPFETFPIYNFDIQNSTGFPTDVNAWADAIRSADGLIIVSPEYNWSIPGGLKNAIDWVYLDWNRKPAAFVSYGGVGGVRSVQQLREVLVEVEVAPLRWAVHIPAPTLWAHFQGGDVNKGLMDLEGSAKIMIDNLLWWTKALKSARAGA